MTTKALTPNIGRPKQFTLTSYLPFLKWLTHYQSADLVGDLMAGVIVTIMLVPQSMAYAMLAGLPPEIGLYASILPLIIYGLLGTSRVLAVGPVAIVSLLVATGVTPLAEPGSALYIALALTLAMMVAVIQTGMGLLRIGFVVNFLSHPVIAGFTSSAALIIGFSQLKHLLGVDIPRHHYFYETVYDAVRLFPQSNWVTFGIGAASIGILLFFKKNLSQILSKFGLPEGIITPLTKAGPLVIVVLGTLVVWGWQLDTTNGVRIVGNVPAGLPSLTLPIFDLNVWQLLLPTAVAISFVGYMESFSVAKALASKRRQKVEANQELIALGTANIGAAFTGGYPVTGGFSRSVVNYAAGANTGLASIITALLILLTVIFLTPLFYFLPQAVLAAIIMVAVVGLIDLKTLRHVWQYNKTDAAAMIITFVAVLTIGVEQGILVGAGVALLMFIWRTSRPHLAIVGRKGDSETYRNVLRHDVKTWPHVLAIRVDESLYFANTKYLEEAILSCVAAQPEVKHLVLIATAVNTIDASALETLEALISELRDAGVTFHMTDIKGPVMDRLKRVDFLEHIGRENIHLSAHEAMKAIGCVDGDCLDWDSEMKL